jgi:regulator of sigma E protease
MLTTITQAAQFLIFLIAGIFGIGFLIGIHEFGHYIFCKLFGVKTPSFSIGFGPKLIEKKLGDTNFILSLIPLGGFVEIAGSTEVGQGEQKESKRADEHSLRSKPLYQKLLIMFGGILFNMLFAVIALTGIFYTGAPKSPLLYPQNATTIVKSLTEDSPSQNTLQPDDRIIKINNVNVENEPMELSAYVKNKPNENVTLTIERDGTTQQVNTTTGSYTTDEEKIGYLGAYFDLKNIPAMSLKESFIQALYTSGHLIYSVFGALKNLFSRRALNGVGGPLMIISATMSGAQQGIKIFLLLLAFISVNLAALNLLPIPILDGGQALLHIIEAIIQRPISETVKHYIFYACWIVLMLFLVVITTKDITVIWGKIASLWR